MVTVIPHVWAKSVITGESLSFLRTLVDDDIPIPVAFQIGLALRSAPIINSAIHAVVRAHPERYRCDCKKVGVEGK